MFRRTKRGKSNNLHVKQKFRGNKLVFSYFKNFTKNTQVEAKLGHTLLKIESLNLDEVYVKVPAMNF